MIWALGFGMGLDARLGGGAAYVGVGAGPTVGVELAEHWRVDAEARWLVLAGNTVLVRAAGEWQLRSDGWSPAAGLAVGMVQGAALRAVTDAEPSFVANVAPMAQVRLAPLRFQGEGASAEVLRLDVGVSPDRGRAAPAFGVTLVEAAVRF